MVIDSPRSVGNPPRIGASAHSLVGRPELDGLALCWHVTEAQGEKIRIHHEHRLHSNLGGFPPLCFCLSSELSHALLLACQLTVVS
jgi:hypothetical protein